MFYIFELHISCVIFFENQPRTVIMTVMYATSGPGKIRDPRTSILFIMKSICDYVVGNLFNAKSLLNHISKLVVLLCPWCEINNHRNNHLHIQKLAWPSTSDAFHFTILYFSDMHISSLINLSHNHCGMRFSMFATPNRNLEESGRNENIHALAI